MLTAHSSFHGPISEISSMCSCPSNVLVIFRVWQWLLRCCMSFALYCCSFCLIFFLTWRINWSIPSVLLSLCEVSVQLTHSAICEVIAQGRQLYFLLASKSPKYSSKNVQRCLVRTRDVLVHLPHCSTYPEYWSLLYPSGNWTPEGWLEVRRNTHTNYGMTNSQLEHSNIQAAKLSAVSFFSVNL